MEPDMITKEELDERFPNGVPMAVMKILFPESSEPLKLDELRFLMDGVSGDIETYYTTENNWENMFFGPGASTTEMDCIWDFGKQTWANADFKIVIKA